MMLIEIETILCVHVCGKRHAVYSSARYKMPNSFSARSRSYQLMPRNIKISSLLELPRAESDESGKTNAQRELLIVDSSNFTYLYSYNAKCFSIFFKCSRGVARAFLSAGSESSQASTHTHVRSHNSLIIFLNFCFQISFALAYQTHHSNIYAHTS
jgi:hypothetical protein